MQLTFFTIPKPFDGHIGVIQRNAIASWTRLTPRPAIVLYGDEVGVAEAAADLNVTHQPDVARNAHGTPLVSDAFARAQAMPSVEPKHVLVYLNADIVLLDDFVPALERVRAWRRRFLMVGRRQDCELNEALNFEPGWQARLRERALREGAPHSATGIDYFAFTRGVWDVWPEMAVGRIGWDTWAIHAALRRGMPVLDASEQVLVVHQNHDYRHLPEGEKSIMDNPEAQQNLVNAGGWKNIFTIDDAPWRLTAQGPRRKLSRDAWRRRVKAWTVFYPRWQRPLRWLDRALSKL